MKNKLLPLLFLALSLVCSQDMLRAEPDNIDVALFQNVPILVQKLRELELRNVGVLPFQFRDNAGVPRSTGALIQTNLAARTEQVIAYIRDVDDPVNVVFGMLAQARALDASAAYNSPEACQKLLALEYKFPVDEMQPSKLDGFVTGVIEVSKDWKQSSLLFQCYDAKTGQMTELGPFSFPTDRKMLMQYGRAYSLTAAGWDARTKGVQSRNIFALIGQDEKNVQSEENEKVAEMYTSRVGQPVDGNPWAQFPVTLTIKYDGQPQELSKDSYFSSFNFSIADPKPNQRVTFELKNTANEKIAVVLAVNGKNLIYEENANDPDSCNKFVLEPGATYSVPGIYLSGLKSYQPLVGAADQQTSELAARFPAEAVGIISLSVYREVPTYDPGGVTHFLSQNNSGKLSNEAVNMNAKIPEATKNKSDKPETKGKSKLEFLSDDSETWHNSFDTNLVRSGSKQTSAKGSFHPTSTTKTAKNWSDLSKGIGRNALIASASRGLIVPSRQETQQQLGTASLGAVSQTDVAIIRYLDVARQ